MSFSSNRNIVAFLPIAIASGFSAAFGLTKALFAAHLLFATTIVSSKVGPLPVVVLSLVDLVIGVLALVGGFAFMMRVRWARNLLIHGSIPLVLFELGRGLGLAAIGISAADAQSIVMSVLLIFCLLVVRLCAKSSASEAYAK